MPQPSRSPLLGLLAPVALVLLAACGGGEPALGVVHLDPRLDDGTSAAAQLAGLETTLYAFEDLAPSDWAPGSTTYEGRTLRAWTWVAPADAPLAAARVDQVLWSAGLPRATRARLSWRRAEDPVDAWLPECSAELSVPADEAGALEQRFDLAGHAAWTGDVAALRLEPDGLLGTPVELRAVRLAARGFGGGFEPLADLGQDGPGRFERDGGLVVQGLAGVRSWPTDFGVPLFAEVTVPAGGRLVTAVSLGARHRQALLRVHLAVDVAPAGTPAVSDAWERAWYRSVVPRMTPGETLWRDVVVDLSDYAGEAVRLRFRSWAGHGQDTGVEGADGGAAELAYGSVLWGAPEVVGDPPRDRRPNLLLVTLDTTRADALGSSSAAFDAAGRARGSAVPGGPWTPFLDDLAAEGIVFERAFAASNSTQPSHASILTGTWPTDHGVHDNYALLSGANETLAEALRAAGYHTVAAVSQRYLGAGTGFGQGFDEFLQAAPGASRDGGKTIEGLRARLEAWGELAPERPVFLWLHLFDPHTPYAAPDHYAAAHAERFGVAAPPPRATPPTLPVIDELPEPMLFLEGVDSLAHAAHRYAVEVSYADGLVENIASTFAAIGQLGATAFFVTADHGESLGEHGSWFNHTGLYDEVVHVPLVVRIPGGPAGLRLAGPASGVDLASTILAYAGAEPLARARGRDLLAGLVTPEAAPADAALLASLGAADDPAERPVFFAHSELRQVGVREGRWHFVTTLREGTRHGIEVVTRPDGTRVPRELDVPVGTNRLYDAQADPGLERDLSAAEPERVARALALLEAWQAAARPVESEAREVTAAERDDLEAIGY